MLFRSLSAPPHVLKITYATPTAAASGAILDIDGTEYWQIRVYATNGMAETNYLYSTNFATPSKNAGDGLATWWSVSHAKPDISSIVFYGSDLDNGDVGWAFDNFSPRSATPPPVLSISGTPHAMQIGLAGAFGSTNLIQYSSSPLSTNWLTLTNAVLTNAPRQFYLDAAASNQPARVYRAVRLP